MSSNKSAVVETDEASLRPLSVFLLIRSLAFGGAQRQLVQLAKGLHERGHRVTVGVFYLPGPLMADLEQAGVSLVDLKKNGRWDVIRFPRRLAQAIREARADVLYSFVGEANVFAAAVRRFIGRTRLVWSIRASDMDHGQYGLAHRLGYALERRLSGAAELIVSNSRAGLEFAAANGFPRERIVVVPNGIDTSRFRPDAELRKAQRTAWGLADDEIAVGMLARLDPMKGHDFFLEAAAEVARTRPGVRFLCIGDGRDEMRLKARAVELGLAERVLFVGPTTEPVSALNGLDVFCSASTWGEGFSNAVGEAMACGLRVIATNVGDSALIVGQEGTVVRPADTAALAKAIVDQVTAPGRRDRPAARTRIETDFSIAAMVDRTLALFVALITDTAPDAGSGSSGLAPRAPAVKRSDRPA